MPTFGEKKKGCFLFFFWDFFPLDLDLPDRLL